MTISALSNLLGINTNTGIRPNSGTVPNINTGIRFPTNPQINLGNLGAMLQMLIGQLLAQIGANTRPNVQPNPPSGANTIPKTSTYPGNENPHIVQMDAMGMPKLPMSATQKAAMEAAFGFQVHGLVDMDRSGTLTAGDIVDSSGWGAAARSMRLDQAQVKAINALNPNGSAPDVTPKSPYAKLSLTEAQKQQLGQAIESRIKAQMASEGNAVSSLGVKVVDVLDMDKSGTLTVGDSAEITTNDSNGRLMSDTLKASDIAALK